MVWILNVLHSVDHDIGANENREPFELVQVLHAVLHLLTIVQQSGNEGIVRLYVSIDRAREHNLTNLVIDLIVIYKLTAVDRWNVPLRPGKPVFLAPLSIALLENFEVFDLKALALVELLNLTSDTKLLLNCFPCCHGSWFAYR